MKKGFTHRVINIILIVLTVVSVMYTQYRIGEFEKEFDYSEIEVFHGTFIDEYTIRTEKTLTVDDDDEKYTESTYYINIDVDGNTKTFRLKAPDNINKGDSITVYRYDDISSYSEEGIINKLTRHYYLLPIFIGLAAFIGVISYSKKRIRIFSKVILVFCVMLWIFVMYKVYTIFK